MFLLYYLILFCYSFSNADYTTYPLTNDPIDVVILLHPKDKNKIDLTIEGIKKFGKNVRRIITISETRLTDKAEWFDEKKFPFYKNDIALATFSDDPQEAEKFAKSERVGWIMKQLFNLYAGFVIPDISSNMLMLDGDTMFLKPVEFIDDQGNALYNPGHHIHEPYFIHASKLISGENQIKQIAPEYEGTTHPEFCGVSHHMLFQKPILKDLFYHIRNTHKMEPWKAICKCFDKNEIYKSAMAEYEIYFNFAFGKTKQVKIRKLKWKDIAFKPELIEEYKNNDYDYVSCHHYIN